MRPRAASGHAELAWQIAAWLEPQLTTAEHAALSQARAQALDRLSTELHPDGLSLQECRLIGWPATPVAAGLLARLSEVVVA